MVRALFTMLMAMFSMVSGEMIKLTVMELITMLMGVNMKAHGSMTSSKAREKKSGLMNQHTRVTITRA